MREPLEVAEHDGRLIPCGQPLDFSMQGFDLVVICKRVRMLTGSARTVCTVAVHRCLRFMGLSPRILILQPPRRPVGDAVEPGTEPIGLPDRSRLAGQDHERSLEGIFGVVAVAEHALTDTEDERAVPHDQGGEGQLGIRAR